ncbi:MAG: ATP-binding protein [Acidobacteriota bacterium]|nr:ATP-binding protein [Acidobacteriota bacterium]
MDELLNHAPCGFLVFADNGSIVEANATLLGLLGYERGEFLKLHIEKIFSVAGRIFYQTHFFPLLKLKGKVEEIYLDLRSKTGESVPALVNAARHEREGKTFNDCIFVAMRQRSEYEDQILLAKKHAEAATVAKDEFLSVVSHELRTPLNAMLGWARMVQDERLPAETRRKGLETILRNAQMQAQLIEDILDFSRIISGKLRIDVRKIDLADVIKAAIDVVTPAANAKNIRLEAILDTKSAVSGDPERLQQVMWNLLTNAIKFTSKGGRVQVRLQRVNSSVEVSVSDTGQGITPDFLPYIFDRFRQQDNTQTRRHGGLGLGMAITRHIVELHGGTIRAESPGEGLGTTFTICLPIMIVHSEKPSVSNRFDNSISSKKNDLSETDSIRLDGFQILIVDDQPDGRELITFVLTQHGADVATASSVPEAIEKLQILKPDLVISDIEMPGEDGFSLIEKLHAINKQQKRKIPAIALTAQARPSERLKVLSAGYQIHLAKPVEPAELLTVVANFLALNCER